ncbi:nucleotidyltransferase domain protein [Dictyocaulus viviparus]|uniref:Nucleotidyltransferase domain protein n=1 Tax=Dictyocaulus viviparus TaxID=29172 RepID=A0A0D8XYM8_DICVI|nr:nucleotidyltransferase domain protein [Dictyocaulus viviparus]
MGLCVLCGSEFPDGGESKSIHESGKRHQKALERYSQAEELTRKSVFVAFVFKQNTQDRFNCFGEVSRVTCDYLCDHAFVEFLSEDAVEKAKAAKSVKISDSLTGVIYERRLTSYEELDGPAIEVDEVVQHVNDSSCRGFSEQVNRVASSIGITQSEISRREVFRKRFEELLEQYIEKPRVLQFGSAVTSLGTNDSDIDLCLLLENGHSFPMDDFIRHENELLSSYAKNFRENRLLANELNSLTIRDQTELVFRILKDIRQEKSGLFSCLHVVSDAQCPVIRFRPRNRHLVELSVNNYIGYKKSSFIGAVIHADQSKLLRNIVLSLRFWAMSNGVFISERKKTWNINSYTLTLMFFTFLQYEKLLPLFSHSPKEEYVNGLRVDFVVPTFTLSNVDLRGLFKKFFVFCIDSPLEKSFFSLRKGCLLPLEEMNGQSDSKQQSVLFVQDPIMTHNNVARNVTSKALKTMRHAMMLSLSAMKVEPDSFAVMLQVLHNETKTSSQISLPPTDYACWITGLPDYFDECIAETVLHIILFSVLQCEIESTLAKRARFDWDAGYLGSLVAYKKLWMSRRTLRKKWSSLLSKNEQFPLLIESLVSSSLSNTKQNDCCLKFQTFFEIYKERLWVGFILIEGNVVDIGNLVHFIDQLLNKLRDFLALDEDNSLPIFLEKYRCSRKEYIEINRLYIN